MVRRGPLKEHDEYRRKNATNKRKVAVSNMPHLVYLGDKMVDHPHRFGVRGPYRCGLFAAHFWYGFDDFDEAVLFMLRYS